VGPGLLSDYAATLPTAGKKGFKDIEQLGGAKKLDGGKTRQEAARHDNADSILSNISSIL
jgi:hypothetical protein